MWVGEADVELVGAVEFDVFVGEGLLEDGGGVGVDDGEVDGGFLGLLGGGFDVEMVGFTGDLLGVEAEGFVELEVDGGGGGEEGEEEQEGEDWEDVFHFFINYRWGIWGLFEGGMVTVRLLFGINVILVIISLLFLLFIIPHTSYNSLPIAIIFDYYLYELTVKAPRSNPFAPSIQEKIPHHNLHHPRPRASQKALRGFPIHPHQPRLPHSKTQTPSPLQTLLKNLQPKQTQRLQQHLLLAQTLQTRLRSPWIF